MFVFTLMYEAVVEVVVLEAVVEVEVVNVVKNSGGGGDEGDQK